MSLILDGDGRSSAERLALWRDAMSLAGKVHVDDEQGFTGTFISRGVGDMRTMQVMSTRFRLERDRDMARQIPRDHVINSDGAEVFSEARVCDDDEFSHDGDEGDDGLFAVGA